MAESIPGTRSGSSARWLRVACAVVALAVLNAGLTFHNVWPTLGIRPPAELSLEVAILILFLALWRTRIGTPPASLLRFASLAYLALVIGRYLDVTAPALYGRPINLFWDARHLTALTGMFANGVAAWRLGLIALGLILGLAVLYLLIRWAIARSVETLEGVRPRRIAASITALLIAVFALQRLDDTLPRFPVFSLMVTPVYARQIGFAFEALSGERAAQTLGDSPRMDPNLARIAGSDVLLVFIESYGAVTYDRGDFARALTPSREQLAQSLASTGRSVVSAFVTSPTFGGASWLAHLSFLSGIEVNDPDRYALMLTQNRPTLVSAMQRVGYRSVALMPGLRQSWPEGRFYGFDDLYSAARLDYRGPEFGWWRIPDQYSLARLGSLERTQKPRRPLFTFYPTINSHAPFDPTPPYQPDWSRMLDENPYEPEALQASLGRAAGLRDLGASYVASIAYTFDTIGGYARMRSADDFLMVVLGDHQPAAKVSGAQASWDVPVHVITDRAEVLAALKSRGFVAGLYPPRTAIAPMHELLPVLFEAFSRPGGDHGPYGPAIEGGERAALVR